MSGILIAPNLIPPTYLSYFLARKVLNLYRKNKIKIYEISGVLASRYFIPVFIKRTNAVYIIYMGHAFDKALCGESLFCDMVTVDDVYIFKDRIVIAMPACRSANDFGRAVVESGGIAYVGSTENMYAAFPESDHDYLDDWVDVFLTFYKSLIFKTVGGAVEDYKKKNTYYINLYRKNRDKWYNADWYEEAFRKNRDYVVVLGDENAKITFERFTGRVEEQREKIKAYILSLVPIGLLLLSGYGLYKFVSSV